jgi:hypothetical protein
MEMGIGSATIKSKFVVCQSPRQSSYLYNESALLLFPAEHVHSSLDAAALFLIGPGMVSAPWFPHMVNRAARQMRNRCHRCPFSPAVEREDRHNMKKLLATASIVALTALPAIAQDATAPAVEKVPVEKSAALQVGGVSAKALLNESVKNAANETIGDINDVIIAGDGKIAAVIVGVGGFLGMGEKDVALPYDQLVFANEAGDDLVVTTSATKESLETAPEYVKPKDRS